MEKLIDEIIHKHIAPAVQSLKARVELSKNTQFHVSSKVLQSDIDRWMSLREELLERLNQKEEA